MTLAIPKELKKEMDRHPEMNWSEVARIAIKERLERVEMLERLDEFAKDSELTEEDAIELGRKVNKALARRHRELGK